ncbi:hypothetical protein FRC17_005092 [Serendipita sp. 399]|nr:hypothetical protein FRC17_005092 [Serendipita sp. 399]
MDDEAADIELLEQHLIKTSNISQRMTSILTSFDTRLIKLEKSILPLHKSTQSLSRLAENIEATLQSIDKLASDQEGVAAEEALILRGPRPNEVDTYIATVERLNASIAFNSGDLRAAKETARIVEAGVKKMCQLYIKLTGEVSSGTPPGGNSIAPLPFPSGLLKALQPIIDALRRMPQPSTHPSHPGAKSIYQTLKDTQKSFADVCGTEKHGSKLIFLEIRGNWAKKCIESMGGRRIIDRVETLDSITAGREVGLWVNGIIAVANAEYDLLLKMSLLTTTGAVQSTYGTLLTPIGSLFTTTLALLINLVKANLNKHAFLALAAYEELTNARKPWGDVQSRTGKNENELKDTLVSLRGICLRSFPEFLLDVRGAGTKTNVELGSGIHEVTSMVVTYLQQIPQVMDAVGTALATLGDGMWKMGEGAGKVFDKSDQDDERLIIEHFVYDVVTTLLNSLNSLATASKKPAQGSIFHFNNVAFLRTKLLLDPETPIDDLLGKPTQDSLNSNYRTAKATYFDVNFSPLVQALGDGGGRRDVKEKLTRFFDALDEASDRHRVSKVLMDDEEGKEMLQEEVVRLVVPALKRFCDKNVQGSKDRTKLACAGREMWSGDANQRGNERYEEHWQESPRNERDHKPHRRRRVSKPVRMKTMKSFPQLTSPLLSQPEPSDTGSSNLRTNPARVSTSRSPIMRDYRNFDALTANDASVREEQALKNLIPSHDPRLRAEVAEGRDGQNVATKGTPRKRRSTFSTLIDNSQSLPKDTRPQVPKGGDLWSPRQSPQATYETSTQILDSTAGTGSHRSKRRQRAASVRYDGVGDVSPRVNGHGDHPSEATNRFMVNRSPEPLWKRSESPLLIEKPQSTKASVETYRGLKIKSQHIEEYNSSENVNGGSKDAAEMPSRDQGRSKRRRESKGTTQGPPSRLLVSAKRKEEILSPDAAISLHPSPGHDDISRVGWNEDGKGRMESQFQPLELKRGNRLTKTMAPDFRQEDSPASSGVTHYVTASDRSTDTPASLRHYESYLHSQSRPRRMNDNVSDLKRSNNKSIMPASPVANSVLRYRDPHPQLWTVDLGLSNGDVIDVKRDKLAHSVHSRTQSPLFDGRSQRHAVSPQVERVYGSKVNAHDSHIYRNDDSLTYVAVTASSHRTDSDQAEELSEAANYGDHIHSRKRLSLLDEVDFHLTEAQAIKRRNALLNGLGLGLSFQNEASLGVPAIPALSVKRTADEHSDNSPSAWIVDDPDQSPINNTPRVDQRVATPNSLFDHAKSETFNSERTPVANENLRSPESLDGRRSGKSTGTRVPRATSNRRASKADIRRNTWVYDQSKEVAIGTAREDGDPVYIDERSDSVGIPWSDSDNAEPLSENAQQMFSQLEARDPGARKEIEAKGEPTAWVEHSGHLDGVALVDNISIQAHIPESGNISPSSEGGPRTWRKTISSSAYHSLLERHGILEMKRQDVLFELCETESDFVRSLKVIRRLFVEPLRSRGRWVAELPLVCINLFNALDEIENVHSQLALALHSARASQYPLMIRFADVVRPFVPRLEAHQQYLVYMNEASKEFEKCIRDPEDALGHFLREQSTQEECGHLGFSSLLLKPMQRLTKYPLFFKQIWELTPRPHVDHLSSFSLYCSTDLVIKVMQEVKAQEEEFQYTKDLVKRIDKFPESFQLAHRGRRLIAQGLLKRVAISGRERRMLDAHHSSKPIQSPRPGSPWSPATSETTPIMSNSSKFGQTSSPFLSPVQTKGHSLAMHEQNQQVDSVCRTSIATSEASHSSECNSSPTSSTLLSSDSESAARNEPTTPHFIRSPGILPPYNRSSPNLSRGVQNLRGTRRKGARETPIYAFIFTDMVIFTSQTGKGGFLQSRSQPHAEQMSLIQPCGLSRIVGIFDVSERLNYEHLLQVDVLPINPDPSAASSGMSPLITSIYFTLPAPSGSHIGINTTEQMKDTKEKWLSAFRRSYEHTIRALSFPFILKEPSSNHPGDMELPSVIALLASGYPLPNSPYDPADLAHESVAEYSEGWWSLQFRRVVRDIERVQDKPVLLIGDVALTMAKGLSRVHTTELHRRAQGRVRGEEVF